MAKKINLGKVGITTAGAYDPNKAYERLSCVTYNYESWVSTKDVPAGNTPQDGSEYWQKMAARGAQGIQGEKGPVGSQGPQGNSGYQGAAGELEVVNNLTDGGEAAALSAEMGKELSTRLSDIVASYDEVISNDDFVLNSGYLAASSAGTAATITTDSSLRYSDPMPVLKGDIVEVESQGTKIACICTTDAAGSSYIAKAISNDGNAIITYTYKVEEDGYIAISSRKTALKGRVLRASGKDRIGNLEDAVSELQSLKDIIYREITAESLTDISSNYSFSVGQRYGTVGSSIQLSASSNYKHTKVYNDGREYSVKLTVPVNASPSSMIQYVDDNDTIIALDAVSLSSGATYETSLDFPDGATAAYVSSYGDPVIYVITYEKKITNIIGDVNALKTDNKVLVDSINEILAVYPTVEHVNIADTYEIAPGQAYGSVGSAIVVSTSSSWRHIRILKANDIQYVTAMPAGANASSLVQYVDDNDTIIALALTKPSAGVAYEHILDFPEGATAAYLSSDAAHLGAYITRKVITPKSNATPSFRFRVLSWNIGHYAKGGGTSSAITADTYESQKMAFRKVFNKYAADIVGLCEYSSIFYDRETAGDAILAQYPHGYIAPTESGYIGTALYSTFGLTDLKEYAVGDYRAYEGHFVANGKDIIICMCHLPWQSEANNKAAIQAMIKRYADHPYVVIMGDMNFTAGHEEECAAMFTEAGFQNANWGYLGKILTSYNNVIASNYLDNVAVKGGCILHTEVLQNTPEGIDPDAEPNTSDEGLWNAANLSDHFPIICDIVF